MFKTKAIPIFFLTAVSIIAAGPIESDTFKSTRLDAGAFYQLGLTHLENQDWEKAIASFNSAIHINPTNALAYLGRGSAYLMKGDPDKAIADYTKLIRLEPTNAIAYQNRATAFRAAGKFRRAVKDLDRCLRLAPTNFTAYACRASVYNRWKDFGKAVNDLTKCLQIDPNNAKILVMRGYAYSHDGEYCKAIDDFRRATQIDPNSYDAYNNIAWLLATCPNAQIRDGKRAAEAAKKACELTSWKDWKCIDTLAAAFAEDGDFERATICEKQSLNLEGVSNDNRKLMERHLSLYENQHPNREQQ